MNCFFSAICKTFSNLLDFLKSLLSFIRVHENRIVIFLVYPIDFFPAELIICILFSMSLKFWIMRLIILSICSNLVAVFDSMRRLWVWSWSNLWVIRSWNSRRSRLICVLIFSISNIAISNSWIVFLSDLFKSVRVWLRIHAFDF